jgi:hypothetical protein
MELQLVHLVGVIIRICHDARSHVTMHGHMNVKKNLFWSLLSTKIKVEMYRSIILPAVSTMCVSPREKHRLECPTQEFGERYLD